MYMGEENMKLSIRFRARDAHEKKKRGEDKTQNKKNFVLKISFV